MQHVWTHQPLRSLGVEQRRTETTMGAPVRQTSRTCRLRSCRRHLRTEPPRRIISAEGKWMGICRNRHHELIRWNGNRTSRRTLSRRTSRLHTGPRRLDPHPQKSGTAETYSLQGEHIGSFPLSGSNAPLLISESGIPTLEQFQKAYESGDTSWAKYVIECTTKDACTFNGTPVTLPFERSFVYPPGRGELQIHWNLSNDQQVLAVSVYTIGGVDSELNDKTSLVIDTQTARVITPPTSSSHIITSLGDSGLLVGIQGAEIVGYTPNHS